VTTRRGAETRQRLLDAAAVVFSQRGFARSTTKEIAEAAGVAEGTIYRHFADKQDLFYATFSAKSAITADEFLRFPELAGKETVRENLRRFVSVIEDIEQTIAPFQASMWSDAELAEALGTSKRAAEVSAAGPPSDPLLPLTRYLEAEQELGRIRDDVDCERAAFALFAIPFASVTLNRALRGQMPTRDLDMMTSLDVVLEGLLPQG